MRKCIGGLNRSSRRFATCAQLSAFADVADQEEADAEGAQSAQTWRRRRMMKGVRGKGEGQLPLTPRPVPLAILLPEFSTMTIKSFAPWLVAGLVAVVPMFGDAPRAQEPAAPAPAAPVAPSPTFRTSVNLVSSD